MTKGTGIGDVEVTGKALVMKSDQDYVKYFEDGDIIVTDGVTNDMVKYIERSKGLIVEEAGFTSQSAITGLNLGIPTIFGVADAIKKIKSGEIITMNCSEGTIKKGTITK